MAPDSFWKLGILALLIILSAFFSTSETALMSLSKLRVRHLVDENIKGAKTVSQLVDNPSSMLASILVGNNMVNIGASALATSLAISYYGASGVGIATAIMTILVLVFAEITPKTLASRNPEQVALKVARPIYGITYILNPIITVLNAFVAIIINLLIGKNLKEQPFITEEELKNIVDVSHQEGVIEIEEKKMIYNVVEFGDLQVKEVMIPRTEMVALNSQANYRQLLQVLKEEQFSRIPVYQDTIDNIIGILYIKDLIVFHWQREEFQLTNHMREPFYTYEFDPITKVFDEMRIQRIHMAIVLDEYGGTVGIVTMEDLLEEIVGDISDEYDYHQDNEIEVIQDNEYFIKGSAKIDLVNDVVGTNMATSQFDSIGGYIIGQLGRFPQAGEELTVEGAKLTVESIAKNRIEKIKAVKLK